MKIQLLEESMLDLEKSIEQSHNTIGDVQQSIDTQNATNKDYTYKLKCKRMLKRKLATKASEPESEIDTEIASLKKEIGELNSRLKSLKRAADQN